MQRTDSVTCLVLAMLLCASWGLGAAPAQRPVLATVPFWVQALEAKPELTLPERDLVGGCFYSLRDMQFFPETSESYWHFAFKVVTEEGVQNNSELRFYHHPDYQTLHFNTLRVFRNGAWKDIAKRVRLEELREESDSSSRLYDGVITTLMILEDIRPGDVVEYAYTIRGANPVFAGKFAWSMSHSYTYPVDQARMRIVMPKQRSIQWKVHNADWRVQSQDQGEYREYTAQLTGSIKTPARPKMASWYYPYPWIEFSEWQSWAEVVDWGRTMFAKAGSKGIAKATWEAEMDVAVPDAERGMLESIRFIQNRIRYLGIEIGQNSHLPHSPAEVLDNRYGDCKDKSLLLCSIAPLYGYKAWPVLADTVYGPVMAGQLPGPFFNHAIVMLEAPGGERWFVDPTWSYQGGSLAAMARPHYGKVLVLGEGVAALQDMPPASIGDSRLEEEFVAGSYDAPAIFQVTSTFQGAEADTMRSNLARSGLREMQDDYLDYYRKTWKDIALSKDVEIRDDLEANVIVVKEYYTIPDLWDRANLGKDNWRVEFAPYNISGFLRDWNDVAEQPDYPLGIRHPVRAVHRTRVVLPEAFNIVPEKLRRESPAFSWAQDIEYHDASGEGKQELILEYRYASKVDSVAGDDAAATVATYKEVGDTMSVYAFFNNGSNKNNPGFDPELLRVLVPILVVAVVMGGRYLLRYLQRRKNPPRPLPPFDGQ